jgi:hypothetical protein
MRSIAAAVLGFLLVVGAAGAQPPSGTRTLRLDYFHTGDTTREIFALDEVVIEPSVWSGSPRGRIDALNYGAYGFDVRDAASKTVFYSHGFGSIYDEWVTTEEAKTMTRTFHESLRFPLPAAPVNVTVRKRESGNTWRDVWTIAVDPKDMFVNSAVPEPSPGTLITFEQHGDPSAKVDLLLLGDGYTVGERGKFEADGKRLLNVLFSTSPFKERRSDFNVWGLAPPSRDSGISRPSLERYVLSFDNKAFRKLASFAPYDVVEIVVNGRTYGGGGIYGLYSTVASDNAFAPYVFVHEFGHHFAALADEYYTSPVAYLPSTKREEPWEPNVTALLDPATLKWKDLVAAGTPLPTPWEKEAYELRSREAQARRAALRKANRPEEEMEALFAEERRRDDEQFGKARGAAAQVGAFEGARYESRGYYRPEQNCIMFTRADFFCAVCKRALEQVIDIYAR